MNAPSNLTAATESPQELQARARRLCAGLKKLYPTHGTALAFKNPFELLMATILSAQCTDEKVNQVTPILFARFNGARALAAADLAQVEAIIHPTGFFHQKARGLQNCARALVERHGGQVPESMDELTALPGVGRKTANLVRAFAMGHPGLIVDTHFKRVIGRLGLTRQTDPDKIEPAIVALLPERDWTPFSSAMIFHGRKTCLARKPLCAECPLRPDCEFGRQTPQ